MEGGDGMIRGTDEVLNFVKEDTRIAPGHGPAGNKACKRRRLSCTRAGSSPTWSPRFRPPPPLPSKKKTTKGPEKKTTKSRGSKKDNS